MSKLLSVLIAAVFAAVTFSAVAAEGAMAPAKPAVSAGAAMTPAKQASKTASPKQRAHRAKMKACNQEAKAKGLMKAERKAFMKSCLKGDSAAPAAQ